MNFKIFLLSTALVLAVIPVAQASDWSSTLNTMMNSPQAQEVIKTYQSGTAAKTGTTTSASTTQVSAGLKEALTKGTQAVVSKLGKDGGFNLDPKVHIPLPAPIAKADAVMTKFGMGSLTADLDTRMNKAAELATPKAGALFVSAIQKMTITDAQSILSGQNDAATQYLRKTMGADLAKEMQPIVAQSLSQAGAVQAYDAVTTSYAKLPLASSLKTNMNDYVVNKAMDGIFYYVGQEEAAIRANPAKQTTALLKTVFGGQ